MAKVASVRVDHLSQMSRLDWDVELELLSKLGVKVNELLTRDAMSVSVLQSVKLFFKQRLSFLVDAEVGLLSLDVLSLLEKVSTPSLELLLSNLGFGLGLPNFSVL